MKDRDRVFSLLAGFFAPFAGLGLSKWLLQGQNELVWILLAVIGTAGVLVFWIPLVISVIKARKRRRTA